MINVTAHRWSGGWELHRDGEPITQTTTLAKAPQQVRDYLDTEDPGVDHSDWDINVVPDIGDLGEIVAGAREATRAAAAASKAAAVESRSAVHRLRAAGYSVSDTAAILGVSRGRISQLTAK